MRQLPYKDQNSKYTTTTTSYLQRMLAIGWRGFSKQKKSYSFVQRSDCSFALRIKKTPREYLV